MIFLFLRNLPATIIPSLSVPLSLVGTLGVMYLLGFSLDNLSLMALTISTGFVVDDAIVMIENIARYVEVGETPLQAALKGAGQIGFTIISLTVSLIAVLIPLLFMGDVVGRLFHEFAHHAGGHHRDLGDRVAHAGADAVRAAAAPPPGRRAATVSTWWPSASSTGPSRSMGAALNWVLDRQAATLVVAIVTLVLTVALYVIIPKGFFPVQDTGEIQGISEAAQTTSYRRDGRASAGAGRRRS